MAERIAVTGPLGFVAGRLLPALRARGVRVIAVVRPGRDGAALRESGVDVRFTDLAAPDPAAFAGAGTVIHLAGMALGEVIVPALEQAGVQRAICVSSAGVHTKLTSPGADAKRRGEARLAASSLAWTVLRPSMIYGRPGDRNVERLLRWVARWPAIPVPAAGATPQQPVHVDDLVQAIVMALERMPAAHTFEIGGPEPVSLRDMILASARAVGRRVAIVSVPLTPAWHAVRLARRVGLPVPVRPEQILRLAESKAVDIGPARGLLGFDPRPLDRGLADEARLLGLPIG